MQSPATAATAYQREITLGGSTIILCLASLHGNSTLLETLQATTNQLPALPTPREANWHALLGENLNGFKKHDGMCRPAVLKL